MQQIKFTGGARIGMSNATWPFATLKITKDRLDLNASIIGNLSFTPDDIISLEPYSGFGGSGLKINHRVPKYKEKVIFWSFKNTSSILQQIRDIGFFENKTESSNEEIKRAVLEKQKVGGFPVKLPVSIAVIIIWNLFFLFDFLTFFGNNEKTMPLGKGALFAIVFILFISVLTLISKGFRKFILKEGKTLEDISRFLYFIIFICAIMFFSILTFPR